MNQKSFMNSACKIKQINTVTALHINSCRHGHLQFYNNFHIRLFWRVDDEVRQLKGMILYSLLLREWPSKDFGIFLDYFGALTTDGMQKKMFKTMAASLFGIVNFEPGQALWWVSPKRRGNLSKANSTNRKWSVTAKFAWLMSMMCIEHMKET